MAKPSSRVSGTTRMKMLGCRQVTIWLDKDEYELVQEAAANVGKSISTYVRQRAFDCAASELQKSGGTARSRLSQDATVLVVKD